MRLSAMVICMGLLPAHAVGQESWFCAEDQATGFRWDEQSSRWLQTNFRAEDKYLIKPVDNEAFFRDVRLPVDVPSYEVRGLGEDFAQYTCPQGFAFIGHDTSVTNVLNCTGFGQFRFDKETLRYMRTYFAGYTLKTQDGSEDTDNTPLISIGTCSLLDNY